ncbi:MAG: hypothetical protein EXR75_08945 [Myxococcales bacterium]|nr:hypothetical protein [Myxococcales bacterium]
MWLNPCRWVARNRVAISLSAAVGVLALGGCGTDPTSARSGGSGGSGGIGPGSSNASAGGDACPPLDACHAEGEWVAADGSCTAPVLADGTACDDGDGCTMTSACQAGACVGGDSVDCQPSDICHLAGTCDPATGQCSNPADPTALGTLAMRCGPLPLLLDMGYGTLGLLPHVKLPGDWNPYLIDGNVDGASRAQLYVRAHAVGLRPYWLTYSNVFEGLLGVELARGKKPNPNDPKGRGLVDECGVHEDHGGQVSACRDYYGACGGAVGEATPAGMAKTFDDWAADGALGYWRDTNTHRSEVATGLLPDAIPAPHIDMLQIDLEGECYNELLKANGEQAEQDKALDLYAQLFATVDAGLAKNAVGGGTSPDTKLGLYGVPVGRSFASPYTDDLKNPANFPVGSTKLGYWSDECRYLVPQLAPENCGATPPVRCDPEKLSITSLGDGYSALGRLSPWMYLTGKQPSEHPAFTWLAKNDDGDPKTYETDDVVGWADVATHQQPFFTRYFTGKGESTSMPVLNRRVGEVAGDVMFPSIYKSAGRIELAWGDVSHNDWRHNLLGLGAPAFEHKTTGHSDPHIAKVFEHFLQEQLETAQLSNRVQLEVAWGWKLFTGRTLAPIITIVPGSAVTSKMQRDPGDPSGKKLCTDDDAIIRNDQAMPNRCGAKPAYCSATPTMPSMSYVSADSVPTHPGRKLVFHEWSSATQTFVPQPAHPEAYTYVQANIEVYAHQSLDEFEYTQVRPMLQAVPHGEIDAVVNWPDTTSLAGLCSGQGRRLRHGGGFHYLNAYGGYENTGMPEPLWMRFYVPGPLTDWCHDGHALECREVLDWDAPCDAGDTCEPHWPTIASDMAIEELCTDAVASYAFARWERVRSVFEQAQASPPPAALAYQPTAFCPYLASWFETKLGMSAPKPMCP